MPWRPIGVFLCKCVMGNPQQYYRKLFQLGFPTLHYLASVFGSQSVNLSYKASLHQAEAKVVEVQTRNEKDTINGRRIIKTKPPDLQPRPAIQNPDYYSLLESTLRRPGCFKTKMSPSFPNSGKRGWGVGVEGVCLRVSRVWVWRGLGRRFLM